MNTSNRAALIKQAVDIVDVIGQAVPLRRSGNRYYGLCPFHAEKTASFHVDGENQLYYCFGCGAGGDVLNFVMRYGNLSFMEAVRQLAERYHVPLPQGEGEQASLQKLTEAVRKEQQELYEVLRAAGDFFYGQLHHSSQGEIARQYLVKRQLPGHVVEEQRLGFAPPDWDGLLRHLRGLGVDPQLGGKAGLLTRSVRNENHWYDRFRNRLIFPIVDEQERVVAFGGRTLALNAANEPKYLNSPETPVYHKGRMLYQYARARAACRDLRRVVLVEGYMDLLAFHARGFYSVAANLGTALTSQQVRLLSRIADEVVLCYDSDDAGERAMLRALPLFLQEALSVSCIRFPKDMDPDDFLREAGLEGFDALLASRRELGSYAVSKVLEGWDGTSVGKARVIAEVQPIMDAVRQPVLRGEYLQAMAERLSVPEKAIENQLRQGKRRSPRFSRDVQPSFSESAVQSRHLEHNQSVEEKIVRWMIKYPELIVEVEASRVVEDFEEAKLKHILEVLLKAPRPPSGPFTAQVVHDLLSDAESQALFTRFVMEPGELREPRIQMRDWLGALSDRRRKKKASQLKGALEEAMARGNMVQAGEILAQIQKLSSTRTRVKDTLHNA